jgi:hypothetical protein
VPGDGESAGVGDARERERLTTAGGLAAMSLDALSSVAYGPETILVVLIPEVAPSRPWLWLLHNQRGLILDRAIRKGTANVVLCRLRFRLETLTR